MKKIDLHIEGMHCSSCVMLIQDALKETSGVQKADVDLKKNRAIVTYDESVLNDKQVMKIISDEGYTAKKAV